MIFRNVIRKEPAATIEDYVKACNILNITRKTYDVAMGLFPSTNVKKHSLAYRFNLIIDKLLFKYGNNEDELLRFHPPASDDPEGEPPRSIRLPSEKHQETDEDNAPIVLNSKQVQARTILQQITDKELVKLGTRLTKVEKVKIRAEASKPIKSADFEIVPTRLTQKQYLKKLQEQEQKKRALEQANIILKNSDSTKSLTIDKKLAPDTKYARFIEILLITTIAIAVTLAITAIVLGIMSGLGAPGAVAAVGVLVGVAAHVGFTIGATSFAAAVGIGFAALASPFILFFYAAGGLIACQFINRKRQAPLEVSSNLPKLVTQEQQESICLKERPDLPGNNVQIKKNSNSVSSSISSNPYSKFTPPYIPGQDSVNVTEKDLSPRKTS